MKIWNPIITLIELRSNQNVMTRNRERCHAQATIATSWPLNPISKLIRTRQLPGKGRHTQEEVGFASNVNYFKMGSMCLLKYSGNVMN